MTKIVAPQGFYFERYKQHKHFTFAQARDRDDSAMISKSRLMMASENPEMQYMWVVNENFQALADSLKQRKNRDTKTEVQSVLS